MAKLIGVLGVAAALMLEPVAPALADASAGTDPTGAHVVIDRRGVLWELGRPGGSGHGSGGGGCQRAWVPLDGLPFPLPGRLDLPPAPSPAHRAFFVYCGTQYLGPAWVLPRAFTVVGTAPGPVELAEQIARDLPYPPVAIGVNPSGRGLTGLESWFWLEGDGYDGPPRRDVVSAFGVTVEVEATPGPVTWDFGDGTEALTGDLGRAGPDSSITHVYERRSPAGPFTVRAVMELAVRYRVDGGPWLALEPVERDAARDYDVVESRAQLVPVEE